MATKLSTGTGSFAADLAYPGWKVVAIGFIIFFFSFGGPTASMPLIYGEVIREFGWTRTEATLIYTTKGLTGAFVAIFLIGPLVERFGLKPVFLTVITAQAAGFAGFLWVNNIWTYYLTGFLIGLGQGATLLCIKLLVARWFIRNVGFAGAMALAGASFGGVVFPMYVVAAIPELGWRMTYSLIGISIFVVAVPLILWVKQDPGEADLVPEAASDKGMVQSPEMAAAVRSADLDLTWEQLIRMPTFWRIMASVMVIALVDQGLFQHSQLYFTREAGLSPEVAAGALSGTFFVAVFSKFLAGKFFDVYSVRGISLWYLLIALMVALAFPVSSLTTAVIFSIALGIAHGGLVTEGPVLAKHVFGPKHMNRVLPVVTGFFSLGSASGPVVLAMFYDNMGSYVWGFAFFIVLALCATAMLFNVKPMYRLRLRAATSAVRA